MINLISLMGKVSDDEWQERVNLAAVFRVAYHYNWNQTINNHISARIFSTPDQFVMNPAGLGWNEITASSLITVDIFGNIITKSDLSLGKSGQSFHTIIQRDRSDLQCIFHIHPVNGVVVSAIKNGLPFFDQNACALYGKVGTHEFEGMSETKSKGERVVRDLKGNYALIMKNHGLLTVGRTIGEAFTLMQRLIKACDVQIQLLATGVENMPIPHKIAELTSQQLWKRRDNAPFSSRTWPAMFRLAHRLDPGFCD